MDEIWLPVVGFEDTYEISNFGNCRKIGSTSLKKLSIGKGHLFVNLWKNNKQKLMRVHRLVLIAFVGPPPPGHECCHNDGNFHNNHIDNLRWDTTANNQHDRVLHGTSNRGERCASSKLKEYQVRAIYYDPRKQKEIAEEYGVLENTISRIKSGKRWGHLVLRPKI